MTIFLNCGFSKHFHLYISGIIFFFFFLSNASIAQERKADSIFTVRKDTLVVKITQVGIDSVKYYQMKDLQNIHSLANGDILEVAYGNGEREMFSKVIRKKYQIVRNGDSKYYKIALPTPFQRSITQWPTEKLLVEQKRFKEKRDLCVTLGILGFVGGTITGIVGLSKIFDSSNSASSLMATGLVVGLSGIPLVVFGALNNKKAKFIRMELERRGVGNYKK